MFEKIFYMEVKYFTFINYIHTPLLGDNPIVLIITSRYLCLVRAKWRPLRLSPLISLSRPHWTTPGHSPLIKSHQLPPQQRQTKNLSVPSPSLLVFRLPSELELEVEKEPFQLCHWAGLLR